MHELFYRVNARGSIPMEKRSCNAASGRGPTPRDFTVVTAGDITQNESTPLRRREYVLYSSEIQQPVDPVRDYATVAAVQRRHCHE